MKPLIYVLVSLILVSCNSSQKEQIRSLVPPSYSINQIKMEEIGIAEYYLYGLNEEVNIEDFRSYSLSATFKEGEEVIGWHYLSADETGDIRKFIETEHRIFITEDFLRRTSYDSLLVAIVYDKDRSALGTEGYSIYDWMELYMLNPQEKELLHISYGKF